MATDDIVKFKGKGSETSDDYVRLSSAYDAVCSSEERLDSIEKEIENAIPKKIDLCNVQSVMETLNKIQGSMDYVQDTMTSSVTNFLSGSINGNRELQTSQNLEVDPKYTKYLATQIILKKFQIIKYRIELIKTVIQITNSKLTKSVLIGIINGKGSSEIPINMTMANTMAKAGAVANSIISVIDSIVTAINSITIMNVNGAGMAFFPTPKSITKVDIKISNVNQSTTNCIPSGVDKAITEAENKIRKSNGELKKAKILAMGAAGAESAQSGKFDPGTFGSLPKFDPSVIRTATMMLTQSIMDAEALPRYEKLSVSNIRFLTFLATGFEPAGKKSFGIPGFP